MAVQRSHTSTQTSKAPSSTGFPLVAVTTYAEVADWADWPQPVVLTPANYISRLVRAGASPVLVPPWTADPAQAGAMLDRMDALLVIGGDDLCGEVYGRAEEPHEHVSQRHNPVRDAFEISAARHAWETDMPMLAICRGIQVLNVALGGSVITDLFSAGYSRDHRIERGVFNNHRVRFVPGSRMAELFGEEALVPSHHHQAIDHLADGLVVTGLSDDGVIEAVEAPDHHFALGVQWHPEEGEDSVLFEAFVAAATR